MPGTEGCDFEQRSETPCADSKAKRKGHHSFKLKIPFYVFGMERIQERCYCDTQVRNKKLLSLFDVDARAKLRTVPFSAIWFPPRVGEQIELRADMEHGGGVYLIVGVRHILEDNGPPSEQTAVVVSVIVDVKPQHAAATREDAAEAGLTLEEIVSVPVAPIPITVELSLPMDPEE